MIWNWQKKNHKKIKFLFCCLKKSQTAFWSKVIQVIGVLFFGLERHTHTHTPESSHRIIQPFTLFICIGVLSVCYNCKHVSSLRGFFLNIFNLSAYASLLVHLQFKSTSNWWLRMPAPTKWLSKGIIIVKFPLFPPPTPPPLKQLQLAIRMLLKQFFFTKKSLKLDKVS